MTDVGVFKGIVVLVQLGVGISLILLALPLSSLCFIVVLNIFFSKKCLVHISKLQYYHSRSCFTRYLVRVDKVI